MEVYPKARAAKKLAAKGQKGHVGGYHFVARRNEKVLRVKPLTGAGHVANKLARGKTAVKMAKKEML